MDHCHRHWFDPAVTTCRDCRQSFCEACVVTVQRVGIICVSCALVRAGVRTRRRERALF
jgi:hypothetical protein